MNNINISLYGFFSAASVGLGVGGAILSSKIMLGGALVSAAALAIFAVVRSHQGSVDERPTSSQKLSYVPTILTCATILGAGAAGIVLGSNALIIAALAAAILSVIQSDMAFHHVLQRAHKSLRSAKENLDSVSKDIEAVSEQQQALEQFLAYLQQNNEDLYRTVQKVLEERKAALSTN